MTEKEARTILEIGTEVDGGCSVCVRELFISFGLAFPEFRGVAREIYRETFSIPGHEEKLDKEWW